MPISRLQIAFAFEAFGLLNLLEKRAERQIVAVQGRFRKWEVAGQGTEWRPGRRSFGLVPRETWWRIAGIYGDRESIEQAKPPMSRGSTGPSGRQFLVSNSRRDSGASVQSFARKRAMQPAGSRAAE